MPAFVNHFVEVFLLDLRPISMFRHVLRRGGAAAGNARIVRTESQGDVTGDPDLQLKRGIGSFGAADSNARSVRTEAILTYDSRGE
jgi:hypothetical protein